MADVRLPHGTRILVTGATSGLGRNAAHWLLHRGHKVVATGRDRTAGAALTQLGAHFQPCDLAGATAHELDSLVAGVDAVWHCAALSSPWGDPDTFQRINVNATLALAQAALRAGTPRFVHISTPSLYFDFQHRHEVAEEFRAAQFANDYARSKYAAEQGLAALVREHTGTRFTLLRPRAIFGPHDRVLLPRILARLAHRPGTLRLPRAGNVMMDMTYVGNVVHAMALSTQRPELPNGAIYNISNHEPVRLAQVLQSLLHKELGMPLRLRSVPYPLLHTIAGGLEAIARLNGREPALTRYSVGAVNFDMTLCTRRAREELGYLPPVDMARAIRFTGDWLRRQRDAAHG